MLLVDVGFIGDLFKGIIFILIGVVGSLVTVFGFLRPVLKSQAPKSNTGKIIAAVIIGILSVSFLVAGIIKFL